MLNIEKYKDIVLDNMNICDIDTLLRGKCAKEYRAFCEGFKCTGCRERFLKWLLEECKEPILDDTEKKYLSAVIKPFRNKVKYIAKFKSDCSENEQYIHILFYEGHYLSFPYFKANSMYKWMKLNKAYTPEELGL
jgi:hypothetical protein